MAIARGAGTEIIRSASFEHVSNTAQPLIIGVQHHIYTVLSVTIFHATIGADGTAVFYQLYLTGYDAYAGTTGETINLLKKVCGTVNTTFVWADKLSFNGAEPTDFSGAMNAADDQDAIADQAQNTSQSLNFVSSSASNYFDVHVTYIDQNNA